MILISTLELSCHLQLREGDREAICVRRQSPPFPFHFGGRTSAGEDGERGVRWSVHRYLSTIGNSTQTALARWRWDCSGGIRNSDFFSTSLMSLLMLVMSRSSVCPLDIEVPGLIGFFCPSLVVVDLERFAYQPEMKSGWLLVTTCLGGSVPFRGSSSSGGLKVLQVLGGSGSPWSDDVLAAGHLLQPNRSTTTKHVVFNMLLKTATTNFLSSPRRRPASGRRCQSPVARKTGRWLQGLGCNFYFFQEYLCNMGCNHQKYK